MLELDALSGSSFSVGQAVNGVRFWAFWETILSDEW